MNFQGRSFLKLLDYTPQEITALMDTAAALKTMKQAGKPHDVLRGKNIALILKKPAPGPAAALRWRLMIWGWA